jgi:predicted transcriptional regulator
MTTTQTMTKPQTTKLQQIARKLGLSVQSLEQYMTTKAAETLTVKPQKAGKASR